MHSIDQDFGSPRTAETILDGLNPIGKLLAITPVMVVLLVVADPITPLLFITTSSVVTVALGAISVRRYVRLTVPLVGIAAGFVLMYPFAAVGPEISRSPVLIGVGPLTVHRAGIEYGVVVGLRILSVVVLSLLFVTTTDTESFLRAAIQTLGVPSRVGYATMASFRFVPMIRSDAETIRAAHSIRRCPDDGGIRGRLRRLARYSIPLFVTAIRRAERTALAMDARAFGAGNERTHYRETEFGRREWGFVLAFWFSSAVLLSLSWQLGFLDISIV